MAAYKSILFAFLAVGAAVTELGSGQERPVRVDEVEAAPLPCRPGVFNPINTITVNTCCNETDDEVKRELQNIKDLLLTIQTGLENGGKHEVPKVGSEVYGPAITAGCINESTPPPRDIGDCYDVQQRGSTTSGIYTIYPDGIDPFDVYCDMDTDGGGWTVFQRRQDGSVDFYLDWADYADGFGSLAGEHWLANNKLFYLSNQKTYRLRVDLEDFEDATRYAQYESFVITDASDYYRLSLGAYDSGDSDAGDAMGICDDEQFSTRDQDHDSYSGQCAVRFKGGWWYASCHNANLNGAYLSGTHSSYADGIEWKQWRGQHYSLKFSEMKLRPV